MSVIENELLEVLAGFKPKKARESVAKYRARLANAADDLEEEVWGDLSEVTQAWLNEASAAINEKEEVPDFDDDEAEDDDDEAEEDDDEAEEDDDEAEEDDDDEEDDVSSDEDDNEPEEEVEMSKPKRKKSKSSKAKAKSRSAEKAKAKGAARSAKPKAEKKAKKGVGAVEYFRTLMLKDKKALAEMKWDKAALLEKTRAAGLECSDATAQTTYSGTRAVVKVLKALNLL